MHLEICRWGPLSGPIVARDALQRPRIIQSSTNPTDQRDFVPAKKLISLCVLTTALIWKSFCSFSQPEHWELLCKGTDQLKMLDQQMHMTNDEINPCD